MHTGGMPGIATEMRVVLSEHLVVVLCNAEEFDALSLVADRIMTALQPPPAAAATRAAFAPSSELVGTWKGTVSTHAADLPLTLTIASSGDVHVKLGSQRRR